MKSISFNCSEIAESIGAELHGDENRLITSIASISHATPDSITFITSRKFIEQLRSTKAAAVIMHESFAAETSTTKLIMDNPYLGYARLTELWSSRMSDALDPQLHPMALVDDKAALADTVSVAPNAVVESDTVLGDAVVIGAGAFIGKGATIGSGTVVHANSTVHADCVIGCDCEIHSGAVIGADGFGFAPTGDGWQKIHQLGRVCIGDRVSVGACTTIDRGALEDTVISDGVILDNHIQVAHNVTIGRNTAIAGCTGIAGSTSIGANCRIGGAVSIVGHIRICDDVVITANSFVNSSVNKPGSYSSGFPLEPSRQWRKNAVRLHSLDELSRQVGKLKS